MGKPRVSVVMPAYNESATIREIVARVLAMGEWVDELVIVDDGSTDGTRELLKGVEALAQERKGGDRPGAVDVRVIFRQKNGGKGAALADAFGAATGDWVLIQDADLEYDPRDYPALLAPVLEGRADAVYGSRFLGSPRKPHLFWHALANKTLTAVCNAAAGSKLTDIWTCYKVFPARVIRALPLESRGFDFEPEVTIKLARLGCRIAEVPISYRGRTYAEGKKIGLKDALIAAWRMARVWARGDLGPLAPGRGGRAAP